MIALERLAQKIRQLPPLPDVVVRLLAASRDPNSDIREMVELVKLEPTLTGRVLRLCNSPYYGLPRTISSVREALVYIGADTLVNYVLAGCLSSYYSKPQRGYGLAPGELWRHSVGCAIASQYLAGRQDEADRSIAFTAGLLHDVGKLLLNSHVEAEYDRIVGIVRERGVAFEEAEREVLGFNHAQAGAEVARAWRLPEPLIEAIEFHQEPERAEIAPRLAATVHLANILCVSFGIGLGSDGLAYTFHPRAMAAVGMEVADLHHASLDILDEIRKAEDLVGLTRSSSAAM
jgi:putative nucleotidyltransferase with HDIG domain